MISVKSVAMSAVGRRASRRRYAGLPGWALILAVLLGVLAPAAQAAPFVTVWMEARINGSGNAYTTSPLAVATGQKVDYRIYARIAPVGTSNSAAFVDVGEDGQPITGVTINHLAESGSFYCPDAGSDALGWPAANGILGMKFNLYQNSTDPVQASFTTTGAAWGTVSVNPDRTWDGTSDATWGMGPGANKGLAQTRAGGPSTIKNLNGIRPSLPVGFYAGVDDSGTPIPMMIISGTTSAMSGTTGKVDVTKNDSFFRLSANTPSDAIVSTLMRVNGQMTGPHTATVDIISEFTLWTNDPVTVYDGVTLYTPWAEAAINNVPPGPFDVTVPGTVLTLNGTVSFSSHTTAAYNWTIDSGTPIQTPTPALTLTNTELMALLGQGQNHTITLGVTTGDGQSAWSGADIVLTPEPATMGLLALGGLALVARRRKKD